MAPQAVLSTFKEESARQLTLQRLFLIARPTNEYLYLFRTVIVSNKLSHVHIISFSATFAVVMLGVPCTIRLIHLSFFCGSTFVLNVASCGSYTVARKVGSGWTADDPTFEIGAITSTIKESERISH